MSRFEDRLIEALSKEMNSETNSEGTRKSETSESDAGFVTDIETDTIEGENYREVLYTAPHSQLVLMSLKPGEEIGAETHEDGDQFIRFESGSGEVILNGKTSKVKDGSAVVIPAGVSHSVINTGSEDLKLYAIYSPPEHPEGTVDKTKV